MPADIYQKPPHINPGYAPAQCFSFSTTALTVDNILKELEGVSWETLSGGGGDRIGILELHPSQRNKIEREYTTEDTRKKAGVTYWTWNHPYSSWRFFITQLDLKGEHAVADKLHHYAEKLTGMLSSYLYYH